MHSMATLDIPLVSPIHFVYRDSADNQIFMKRDDLIPFSFGGNKVRKAIRFFNDIDEGNYDCVVTYGTSSSNHCRVVANLASSRGIDCFIIGPTEKSEDTFNKKIIMNLGAQTQYVPIDIVSTTIDAKIKELKDAGRRPYFIAGGGHGDLGTQAYVECYGEIYDYEQENNTHFGHIFLASGTGCTQAGLVCGQILHHDDTQIVGISIARTNPRGRDVIINSAKSYLTSLDINNQALSLAEQRVTFSDKYISGGYGVSSEKINRIIDEMFIKYGIPLDPTYTGKAFAGMREYISEQHITNQNILFLHTGGMPLFFDFLQERKETK